jgi:hypothetical protein
MKAMLGGAGMGAGGMPGLGALSSGLGGNLGNSMGVGLAKGIGSSLANRLPGLGGKPSGKK